MRMRVGVGFSKEPRPVGKSPPVMIVPVMMEPAGMYATASSGADSSFSSTGASSFFSLTTEMRTGAFFAAAGRAAPVFPETPASAEPGAPGYAKGFPSIVPSAFTRSPASFSRFARNRSEIDMPSPVLPARSPRPFGSPLSPDSRIFRTSSIASTARRC